MVKIHDSEERRLLKERLKGKNFILKVEDLLKEIVQIVHKQKEKFRIKKKIYLEDEFYFYIKRSVFDVAIRIKIERFDDGNVMITVYSSKDFDLAKEIGIKLEGLLKYKTDIYRAYIDDLKGKK